MICMDEIILVKIFEGSSKIFKDPQRSAKICKGLVKILKDKDLSKINSVNDTGILGKRKSKCSFLCF